MQSGQLTHEEFLRKVSGRTLLDYREKIFYSINPTGVVYIPLDQLPIETLNSIIYLMQEAKRAKENQDPPKTLRPPTAEELRYAELKNKGVKLRGDGRSVLEGGSCRSDEERELFTLRNRLKARPGFKEVIKNLLGQSLPPTTIPTPTDAKMMPQPVHAPKKSKSIPLSIPQPIPNTHPVFEIIPQPIFEITPQPIAQATPQIEIITTAPAPKQTIPREIKSRLTPKEQCFINDSKNVDSRPPSRILDEVIKGYKKLKAPSEKNELLYEADEKLLKIIEERFKLWQVDPNNPDGLTPELSVSSPPPKKTPRTRKEVKQAPTAIGPPTLPAQFMVQAPNIAPPQLPRQVFSNEKTITVEQIATPQLSEDILAMIAVAEAQQKKMGQGEVSTVLSM